MQGMQNGRKRIVHVCSGHTVDDARVFHRACLSLAEAGYDVHLIGQSTRPDSYVQDGVTIHPLPPARARFIRMARRYKIANMAVRLEPDLFHIHEPELLGPVLVRSKSKPVIWDAHESYLDIIDQREWIPYPLRSIAKVAWNISETRMLKKCSAVITVTDRIAERYRKLHTNVSVIANYPKHSFGYTEDVVRVAMTCVFAGGLRSDRGLFQAVTALAVLRAKGIDLKLLLAGPEHEEGFMTKLYEAARSVHVDDLISYHGVLSKKGTWDLIRSSQIGLVTYLPSGNNMLGMPTKLLECMLAGTPVVYSHFASYREIAGRYDAGISVDPLDPVQIADALERIITNPLLADRFGENGRKAVTTIFNWEAESKKLLELYRNIFNGNHLPSVHNVPAAVV